MNETKIEWSDKTWNCIVGCENSCPYCYAKKQARRNAMMMAGMYLKRMGIQYRHLGLEERMEVYRDTPVWCEGCYNFVPHAHLDRLAQISPKQSRRNGKYTF